APKTWCFHGAPKTSCFRGAPKTSCFCGAPKTSCSCGAQTTCSCGAKMRLTFLGTGTSTGVPSIACDCETCTSDDPHDKRLRVSVIIEHAGSSVLIDTSSDFRQQALRYGLKRLDAVLVTHCHADH